MSYNPYSLEGKTILMMGAPSGIGKATAVKYSRLGARVVITGRDEKRSGDTFSLSQGDSHIQLVTDLGKEEDLSSLVNRLPALDGITHIAGIVKAISVVFLKKQDIRHLFDVGFFVLTLLTTDLLKQKKIRRPSPIVSISPVEGPPTIYPGDSVYSASKNAVQGMIGGLSVELTSKRIGTNAVLSGATDTPTIYDSELIGEQLLSMKSQYPLKHAVSPEEIAWVIIYLLSDASDSTTGASLVVDGGLAVL